MWCEPVDRTSKSSAHGCPPMLCGCGSRRGFLRSVAAVGASAILPAPAVWAQEAKPAEKPHRVDVHHHVFPPFLQEAWQKANVRVAPVAARWTLDATLDQMNRGGVATAILSLASGGLNLPDPSVEDNRRLTRMVNDYVAKTQSVHRGRF